MFDEPHLSPLNWLFGRGSDRTLGGALTEGCTAVCADTDIAGDFRGLRRAFAWPIGSYTLLVP